MSDMTMITLVIAALAVWQAVEVWHHGAIFASVRARLEVWDTFFSRLLHCPFCLSLWVAWAAVLPPLLVPSGSGPWWAWRLFVYGLAVSRLANLANDLMHTWCRTPRYVFDDTPPVPPRDNDATAEYPDITVHDASDTGAGSGPTSNV